jgi:hypothetical protein
MDKPGPTQVAHDAWAAIHESEQAERERRDHDPTLLMLRKILGAAFPTDPERVERSAAEALLDHPEWSMRVAGVVLLRTHWPRDCKEVPRLSDKIRQLSASDPNEQVRGVALHTIGLAFAASQDPQVGGYLARLVLDTGLSSEIRASAYLGLCWLDGARLPVDYKADAILDQVDREILRYYIG